MRRNLLVMAVVVVAAATWYAAIRTVLVAESVVVELDNTAGLAELAPRPQATIVYDREGKPAFTLSMSRSTPTTRHRP